MRKKILFFLIFCPIIAGAGNIIKRTINAARIESTIIIDGILDEEQWKIAAIADDFTNIEPNPGVKSSFETEVKILYNDNSLYIGAFMKDPNPEKIMRQLTARDETGNASFFTVVIDPYQSGINGFGFSVTAAGVQSDFKILPKDEDDNWDAVWNSKVKITDEGWIVEMEIPYSALRFPETAIQNWNINFGREVRRLREKSFWNPIDPKINGFINQSGTLEGIKDIKTPVRIMITPYVSFGGSVNTKQENSQSSGFSGGLDLKYGINDAFTLDMTLIPDFSQVKFDEEILNLSPFEVQFDENRAFFTEGTELFNKAGLFYSRRIGGSPFNLSEVRELEDNGIIVSDYATKTQLLNASKLSGRTKKGLGIGVFNAIVDRSSAYYTDNDGQMTEIEVNPLTNFNVVVADQQLKNNSFVSFINTNVSRFGEAYDANVTGAEFSLLTEDQKYQLAGSTAVSQKYYADSEDIGYTYRLNIGKISGNYNYSVYYSEESPNYDINDIGFLRSPNERTVLLNGSYNNFDPTNSRINRYSIRLRTDYKRLVSPNVFTDFAITGNGFLRTSGFIGTGGFFRLEPVKTYDYFEPRTGNYSQFYTFPTNFMVGSFISSNYNKPIAFDANMNYRIFNEEERNSYSFQIRPRWRANDRLSLDWSYNQSISNNDVGFVSNSIIVENIPEAIIFGKRDRNTIVNEISTKVIFNENMYINLIGRHYWSKVIYNDFHLLNVEGNLDEIEIVEKDEDGRNTYDRNFNLLNMDLVYNWRFAPGSDLVFVIKNFASNSEDPQELRTNYLNSVKSVYEYNNNFSMNLKVLYFLDYHKVINKKIS